MMHDVADSAPVILVEMHKVHALRVRCAGMGRFIGYTVRVKLRSKIVGGTAFERVRLGEKPDVLYKAECVCGAPPGLRVGFDRRGIFVETAHGRKQRAPRVVGKSDL